MHDREWALVMVERHDQLVNAAGELDAMLVDAPVHHRLKILLQRRRMTSLIAKIRGKVDVDMWREVYAEGGGDGIHGI